MINHLYHLTACDMKQLEQQIKVNVSVKEYTDKAKCQDGRTE